MNEVTHETPQVERRLGRGEAVLLVNTKARSGARKFAEARLLLREAGLTVAHAVEVNQPESMQRYVQAAIDGGARTVIVGGGDGTLSSAANVILRSNADVALAALPMGTGNDFTRGLGMSRKLSDACAMIAKGLRRQVDVGRVNDRFFLNAASLGLTTSIAEALTPQVKRRLGPFAYAVTAARCGMRQVPFLVKLRRQGEPELELPVLQLVVGNGPFHGGGRRVSPEASLNDAKLDVYAILAGARSDHFKLPRAYQLLRIGARMNKGRHVDEADVLQYRTTAVEVEAVPTQAANVDGELVHHDKLSFSVVPRALTVIAR